MELISDPASANFTFVRIQMLEVKTSEIVLDIESTVFIFVGT